MTPLPHQITKAAELVTITKRFGYSLLFGLPRSGKSLTALLAIESFKASRILILCPKAAIAGWTKFIDDTELKSYLTKQYTVTNYEAIGSWKTRTTSKSGKEIKPIKEFHPKLNTDDYDLVILDESHRIGGVGKPSQRYKSLQIMLTDKPRMYLSGTPFIEKNALSAYYMFTFPKYTPFQHKSFYCFFRQWGIKSTMFLHGKEVNQYKFAKPELLKYIANFTVAMDQTDAGISKLHQVTDEIHQVPLSSPTLQLIAKLQSDLVITVDDHTFLADTKLKLNSAVHQIEGGTLKVDATYLVLDNTERIDYIKQVWGDTKDMAIMCHYKAEATKLEAHFTNATIYSSIRHAEGVDLSHHKHLIIYSLLESGNKYTQLRERTVNLAKQQSSIAHFLITPGMRSQHIYETVANKLLFNTESYNITKE